eukprot:6753777-Alexandrium_andersonii.AAC.1
MGRPEVATVVPAAAGPASAQRAPWTTVPASGPMLRKLPGGGGQVRAHRKRAAGKPRGPPGRSATAC